MIKARRSDDHCPLILILAGGVGSRVGGEKPLLELGGARLIDHALGLARQYGEHVVIGLRHHCQFGTTLPCILDDPKIEGPLAGVMAGLADARRAGLGFLLLLPVDMPFLPNDLLDQLSGALRRNSQVNVAMARNQGQAHPVCSLWRSDIGGAASNYIATGRRSLFGLADAVGSVCVDWNEAPDPFFNVNTAEDLKAARQRRADQNARTSTRSPEE